MAFTMTASVTIGPFKPVKPHAMTWRKSVDNLSDTATVKLPATSVMRKEGDQYEQVPTGLQITEGMAVRIEAGYDRVSNEVFKGFVKRVNFTNPVEVECEGYSYELRKALTFTRAYKNTTVRAMLSNLIAGTSITLSQAIPEIPIPRASFPATKFVTRLDVLAWFKNTLDLTVRFTGNQLYCGGRQLEPSGLAKFKLGWNVVKDSDLKFNANREFAEVRIIVEAKRSDGTRVTSEAGPADGPVKIFKTSTTDRATLDEIAEETRRKLVNRGYEGSISAFLLPYVQPGMAIDISDNRYPQRTGRYFVPEVEGTFGPQGGRQKIVIGNAL